MLSRRDELESRLVKLGEENRVLSEDKIKLERTKKLLESNLETAKAELTARDSLINKMKQVSRCRVEDNLLSGGKLGLLQKERKTGRHRRRQRDRQTQKETKRQADTEGHRETGRHRRTQRDRDRQKLK